MKYEKKPIWLAYVIDYSMCRRNPDTHFADKEQESIFVYEVQAVNRSNNHELSKDFPAVKAAWLSHQNERFFENKHTIQLPYTLHNNKSAQKIALSLNHENLFYLPKYLILHRYSHQINEQEILKINTFYEACKQQIVIKSNECLGRGNHFIEHQDLNFVIKSIEEVLLKNGSCILEALIMPPYVSKHANNKNTGTYRRSIIHYNTETGELDVFDIYKDLLDMDKSTDSHDETARVYEKQYHTEKTDLNAYLQNMEKRQHKLRFQERNYIFKQISESIIYYIKHTTLYQQFYLTKMNTDKATLPVIQCMRPDLPEVRSHINEPSLTHRQDISINRNAFLSEKDLCLSLKNLGLDIASDEQKTNKTLKPLNDLIRLTNLALNALSSSVFLCLITPNNHKTQGLKNILYFLISLKKTQHSVKHNQAILEDLFKMVIGTSVIPRGIFKSYTNAGKAIVRALNEPKYAYFKEVIRPNAAKIRYADLFDFIAQTPKDISHESYRISMYAQTTALWCSENTRGAFVREIARHGIDSVINLRKQSMNRLQYKGPYRDVKFN